MRTKNLSAKNDIGTTVLDNLYSTNPATIRQCATTNLKEETVSSVYAQTTYTLLSRPRMKAEQTSQLPSCRVETTLRLAHPPEKELQASFSFPKRKRKIRVAHLCSPKSKVPPQTKDSLATWPTSISDYARQGVELELLSTSARTFNRKKTSINKINYSHRWQSKCQEFTVCN